MTLHDTGELQLVLDILFPSYVTDFTNGLDDDSHGDFTNQIAATSEYWVPTAGILYAMQ